MTTMTVLDSTGATQTIIKPDYSLSAGVNVTSGWVATKVATSAYAANAAIGSSTGSAGGTALQTIANFFRTAGGSATINSLHVMWLGAETNAVTFYIFASNPTGDSGTTITDQTTIALGSASYQRLACAPITVTPAVAGNGLANYVGTVQLGQPVVNADGTPSKNLYLVMAVSAAVTPAGANDLVFQITGAQD